MSGSTPNGVAVSEQKEQPAATGTPAESSDAAAGAAPPQGTGGPVNAAREAKKAEKEAKKAQAAEKAAAKKAAAAAAAAENGGAAKAGKKDKPVKESAATAGKDEVFVNPTAPGEKKDLSGPMPEGYNPTHVEASWDAWWEKVGVFKPSFGPDGKPKPEGTFVVPLPPPNVTGALHIGHALTVSVQDCLTRWYRMSGKTVLYSPGYDHAGISTQSVVEKRLWKNEKLTRHDLGREKLIERIFEWKDQYQARITSQMRRLGASCDWERAAFTMDKQRYAATLENFVLLHEKGLIYRANRLVNWCCMLRTTISNIECDTKEISGKTFLAVPGYDAKEKFEFGTLTSFAYEIEGTDERIIVATTRPETMVGDTGIAVHPEDPRYMHLHGKYAIHPFIEGRKMPIVLDSELVDMELGTGAVKITPAHDPNDYACGKRHNLEFINILNDDGTFNENAGPFAGMKRYHARKAVIKALTEKGLYIETTDNPMKLQVCSKSGDIIEPILKPQWWVNCTPLAEAAVERTRAGELQIRPAASEGEWYRWLEAPQDWCISRQLWWGHRVPAYFVDVEGEASDDSDDASWIVARTQEEAEQKAAERFAGKKYTLRQDEDVLDTWFSSGLWPFSTVGWPEKTFDLEHFYPASLLETGWDILFFWVARMVMLGIELTGKMPFKEVFCHAMIRDAQGRKMSKSLGNVIDPIDVIQGISLEALNAQLLEGNLDEKEITKAKAGQKSDFPKGIPQCGADALRFTLCAYTTGGRDINLNVLRVEGYRKFCNKIWNAIRFAMVYKFPADFVPAASAAPSGRETLVERWILSRLEHCSTELNRHLEGRNFQQATTSVYDFWLYELCDIYIEAMKPLSAEDAPEDVRRSAQDTLYTCLDLGLKLLHPFMPFVTEELWQRLPRRPEDKTISIALAEFPKTNEKLQNPNAEKDFALIDEVAAKARSLAAVYGLRTGLQVFVQCSNANLMPLLQEQIPTLLALVKGCTSVKIVEQASDVPEGCSSETIGADIVVHLLVKGLINVDAELAKAEKKIALAQTSMNKLKVTLERAETPEEIKAKNAEELKVLEAEIAALTLSTEQFAKMR